jgi:hypothetical protein
MVVRVGVGWEGIRGSIRMGDRIVGVMAIMGDRQVVGLAGRRVDLADLDIMGDIMAGLEVRRVGLRVHREDTEEVQAVLEALGIMAVEGITVARGGFSGIGIGERRVGNI